MSTPHDQGGGGRASKPPARVSPTNTIDFSILHPTKTAQAASLSDPVTAIDQAQRPSIIRRAAGPVPSARAAQPNMSSSVGGNPEPNAATPMRKRRVESFADAFARIEAERAAKRQANASTRSELAFGDAAGAQEAMSLGNMNDKPTISAAERMKSMSPGEVEPDAASTSMETAYIKREQPSTDMVWPSISENYKTATSTIAPVKNGQWVCPRSESIVRSAHGGYRQTQGVSSPGAPAVQCRACGLSHWHMTGECHVPSKDGTVAICPFHNCSVHDQLGSAVHPLDGLTKYAPGDRLKTPLYCEQVMRYEMAIERDNVAKIREMLPRIFKELVVKRRRKPCCRVVNTEVCFINIAIEYSLQFCHGKMPAELQGMWPYTMRDATDPAILQKLEQYHELGWKNMPPSELEAKPWEHIKREYAQGIIPYQIHSKNKPYYRYSMDADVDDQGSFVQESAVQSQDPAKTDVIIQLLGVLNDTANANSEQLAALSEQVAALSEQVAADSAAKAEQISVLSERLATLSEQVAGLSTRDENADALSHLREEIAAVSKKIDTISDNKKDFLRKIVDSLP